MRSLVAFAVRRRITILMASLAAIAFGIVGYDRLSLDLLPDITYPSLTVRTEFPDTAPAEVENLVTRPIEETVGVLRGLQRIHSVSRNGVSEVTLEFDWDADMDVLSMDVREKLDRLVLPDETEDPIVLRFDPSLDPIMRLALSGPDPTEAGAADETTRGARGRGDPATNGEALLDLASLRRVAEKRVKQELETIQGVAAAQVKGGLEEEIQIDVDQERLAALGISIDSIEMLLAASNLNLPGGSLKDDTNQYLIRTVGEFRTVSEIGDLVVRQDAFGVVRLKDVALVRRGAKDREEITRFNGAECVEVSIFKEGDANSVSVARGVRQRLGAIEEYLPEGYGVTVLFDQSRFIEKAVREVRDAAVIGGVLAVLVLFAFLRDVRSTLIITTAIPISVVATFMIMYRLDVSLNIMSLGGLTLGIGMLVDNAIVVLESIFRRRQDGLAPAPAAVEGTTEVGGAVLASTLTTVAVFLPIVFVEGIAGQLFKDMALTVTFSLLASLMVAITLIPTLSAAGRPRRAPAVAEVVDDGAVIPMTLGRVSVLYDRFLRAALRHRGLTVATAGVLFVAALLSLRTAGSELIPSINEGEFYYEVTMPEGTPLQGTDRVMTRMEASIQGDPEVGHFYSTVGSRLVAGGMSLNTRAENLGQVNLVMRDRSDEAGQIRLAERLRADYVTIPELRTRVGRPTYFSLKTPIEVVLFSENLDELRRVSFDLEERLRQVDGLVDVRGSLEEGSPELQIIFDRARLAALGLDMRTLSQTLQNRIQGDVATRFKEADQQIDVRVRNREEDRATVEDVRNLILPGPDGRQIRLLTVAEIREDRGPAEVHRLQQQRAAMITANLDGRSLGSAVREIESVIAATPTPGVGVELGGQNREMQVSFQSLRFALILAIFLVYLVMAATFESLIHPFVVLFTIPLALVGVAVGLLVTGTVISVIVLIGTVMLVGIVVNNAIVLIDTVNQFRRAGMEKGDAVIQAGHARLRPILMTTLTTVLALIPMTLGLGEGSELRTPLAITVSFGLLLSTLLTLVVIPATYMLVPSRVSASEV